MACRRDRNPARGRVQPAPHRLHQVRLSAGRRGRRRRAAARGAAARPNEPTTHNAPPTTSFARERAPTPCRGGRAARRRPNTHAGAGSTAVTQRGSARRRADVRLVRMRGGRRGQRPPRARHSQSPRSRARRSVSTVIGRSWFDENADRSRPFWRGCDTPPPGRQAAVLAKTGRTPPWPLSDRSTRPWSRQRMTTIVATHSSSVGVGGPLLRRCRHRRAGTRVALEECDRRAWRGSAETSR